MATTHGMQVVMGIAGGREALGPGIMMSRERFARVELPEEVTIGHVKAMQKDFETIAAIVEQNPEDVLAINNAVLKNDHATARELTNKVGLNEETLRAAHGGAAGVAVGAVVLVLVLGALLEHDTPPTPQPSPQPAPADGGAPDAGPG